MVSKTDYQTIVYEFHSHWAPYISSFEPQGTIKKNKFPINPQSQAAINLFKYLGEFFFYY